jgi:hypothetical protein
LNTTAALQILAATYKRALLARYTPSFDARDARPRLDASADAGAGVSHGNRLKAEPAYLYCTCPFSTCAMRLQEPQAQGAHMVNVKQPNPWLKARVTERKQFHRFIDVEVEAMLARGPRGVLGVLKAGPDLAPAPLFAQSNLNLFPGVGRQNLTQRPPDSASHTCFGGVAAS